MPSSVAAGQPRANEAARGRCALARCTRGFIAYGVPFHLCADSESVLQAMLSVLPFGTATARISASSAAAFTLATPRDGSRFKLSRDALTIAHGDDLDAALALLGQELLLHVGVHAPDRIFVHAGVVSLRGRALLLPGFSCAGKTTLVAELIQRGATYYSDDYALLDARGMVHPYARDLQVREPGRSARKKIAAADLNGKTASEPGAVALVVFTEFVEGAAWHPEPLSPGLAALEMLRHAIAARQRPAQSMAAIERVMSSATAWRSPRGEASLAAESLLRLLTRR